MSLLLCMNLFMIISLQYPSFQCRLSIIMPFSFLLTKKVSYSFAIKLHICLLNWNVQKYFSNVLFHNNITKYKTLTSVPSCRRGGGVLIKIFIKYGWGRDRGRVATQKHSFLIILQIFFEYLVSNWVIKSHTSPMMLFTSNIAWNTITFFSRDTIIPTWSAMPHIMTSHYSSYIWSTLHHCDPIHSTVTIYFYSSIKIVVTKWFWYLAVG